MSLSVLRGFPKLPPGRPGDPGLFGPGSEVWRIGGEAALLAGGQRALLMQVAHPLVAAGVARHSGFPADAWARLWRTMDAMLTITFGDTAQAREAAAGVNAVHRRIRGVATDGTPYDAMEPALLLWVHATLVDSALVTHERFVGPLPPPRRERYYREMAALAELLSVPPGAVPPGLEEFRAYVARTVRDLEPTEEARALARDVLWPPVPAPLRPAAWFLRLATIDLLPPPLRQRYGLSLSGTERRIVAGAARASRAVLPLLPPPLRRWPHARRAARRASAT